MVRAYDQHAAIPLVVEDEDEIMKWIRNHQLNRAIKAAQRVHAMEHETGLDLTYPCSAVCHLRAIDVYQTFDLDDNDRRKFLAAGGQ